MIYTWTNVHVCFFFRGPCIPLLLQKNTNCSRYGTSTKLQLGPPSGKKLKCHCNANECSFNPTDSSHWLRMSHFSKFNLAKGIICMNIS